MTRMSGLLSPEAGQHTKEFDYCKEILAKKIAFSGSAEKIPFSTVPEGVELFNIVYNESSYANLS